MAGILQKTVAADQFDPQANIPPEIDPDTVLLKIKIWRASDLFWWYWSPERDNPILNNVQSMAARHWFHPLKLHETIRHDDF